MDEYINANPLVSQVTIPENELVKCVEIVKRAFEENRNVAYVLTLLFKNNLAADFVTKIIHRLRIRGIFVTQWISVYEMINWCERYLRITTTIFGDTCQTARFSWDYDGMYYEDMDCNDLDEYLQKLSFTEKIIDDRRFMAFDPSGNAFDYQQFDDSYFSTRYIQM